MKIKRLWKGAACALLAGLWFASVSVAGDDSGRIQISTGAYITPLAAPGSTFQLLKAPVLGYPDNAVDHAETSVVSPDGKTMLVLTSGYNQYFAPNATCCGDHSDPVNSGEYIFVFDITTGNAVQKQILKIPNGYSGIVWAPNGQNFHVAGGQDFDLTFGKSFGEKFSFGVTCLNVTNLRVLLDNSFTFGGTHYNYPREIYGQFKYRFHF